MGVKYPYCLREREKMTTTKTYFLTEIPNTYTNEKRLIITENQVGNILKTVTAENWLTAKLKLGYELTDTQEFLLKNKG